MSVSYVVKDGDTLAKIARKCGLKTWQELYYSPDNTSFRTKRANPNLIYPGDTLMIPEALGNAPSGAAPIAAVVSKKKQPIEEVSALIKDELDAAGAYTDIEYLARLYSDERIEDSGAGNDLQRRLLTILKASGDARNRGLTHFSGIFAKTHQTGIRKAFLDPWPNQSGNQVGHFTTAVDMGFRPMETYSLIVLTAVEKTGKYLGGLALGISPALLIKHSPEQWCIRLIIGHEQVPDDSPSSNYLAAVTPDDSHVSTFEGSVTLITPNILFDIGTARAALSPIPVGKGTGNSREDLLLSLYGFGFGKMIKSAKINSLEEAALWIRTQLGMDVPDVPQIIKTPLPNTGTG
jgi:hypothetical protein